MNVELECLARLVGVNVSQVPNYPINSANLQVFCARGSRSGVPIEFLTAAAIEGAREGVDSECIQKVGLSLLGISGLSLDQCRYGLVYSGAMSAGKRLMEMRNIPEDHPFQALSAQGISLTDFCRLHRGNAEDALRLLRYSENQLACQGFNVSDRERVEVIVESAMRMNDIREQIVRVARDRSWVRTYT